MDRNNDFFKNLKVSNSQPINLKEEAQHTQREVYTCLRLMQDTYKVQDFLVSLKRQENENNRGKILPSRAINYFYTICSELGYAEFDFRNGKINSKEFDSKIDETCKKYNLDFKYLIDITEQISSLEKEPNKEKSIELAQSIEAGLIKKQEKRTNDKTQKEHD